MAPYLSGNTIYYKNNQGDYVYFCVNHTLTEYLMPVDVFVKAMWDAQNEFEFTFLGTGMMCHFENMVEYASYRLDLEEFDWPPLTVRPTPAFWLWPVVQPSRRGSAG